MSTHNIQFHDKKRKSLNICFLELLEGLKKEFESSTVTEPSGFEPLRLYCMCSVRIWSSNS